LKKRGVYREHKYERVGEGEDQIEIEIDETTSYRKFERNASVGGQSLVSNIIL